MSSQEYECKEEKRGVLNLEHFDSKKLWRRGKIQRIQRITSNLIKKESQDNVISWKRKE